MVKDHSDSKRGNPLFLINCKGSFYAPPHKEHIIYHNLCYTSRGALAGTGNSSMGPPRRIDPMTQCTMSECYYHGAMSHSLISTEAKCYQMELILLNLPGAILNDAKYLWVPITAKDSCRTFAVTDKSR